jgi:replicative DNA helicase
MSEQLRTPPNNTEAERAVLGSVLLDASGRSGDRVMDLCLTGGIVPESFFDPRNRIVYSTMLEMNRAAKPLDAVTLIAELRRSERLDTVGGVGYVQNLVDMTPTTAHAEYYISLMRDKHLRRRMIERASETIEKCFNEGDYPDPAAVLGDAEKGFLEIGAKGADTMPWSDAVSLSFERLNAMFDSDGKTLEGLPTGLTHLDEKLQGLKPSEMM